MLWTHVIIFRNDVPYTSHEVINKINNVCCESVSISNHYSISDYNRRQSACNMPIIYFPDFKETWIFSTDFLNSSNINFQVSNFYVSQDVSYDTRRDMANLNVDFSEYGDLPDNTNSLHTICRFILMSTMWGHSETDQFIQFLINYFFQIHLNYIRPFTHRPSMLCLPHLVIAKLAQLKVCSNFYTSQHASPWIIRR